MKLYYITIMFFLFFFGCTPNKLSTKYEKLLGVAKEENFPGMVLWIKEGNNPGWSGSIGYRNIEKKIKMTVDTRFYTGSLTKLITAIAILQLVESSKVTLADKVINILGRDIVGKIPNINDITVGQLMNHQSGIYSANNNMRYINTLIGSDADKKIVWKDYDFLALTWTGNNKPFGKPGEGAFYGDNNYILLGLIIEKISGILLRNFVQLNIFDRVKMKHSYYCTDSAAIKKNKVFPHTDGYLVLTPEIRQLLTIHPKFYRVNDTLINTTSAIDKIDGAAAIISTAEDVGILATALFNGDLLSASSKAALFEFAKGIENDKMEKVRQGAMRAFNKSYGVLFASEGDGPAGFNTIMAYLPATNTIVVGFINIFGMWKEKETIINKVIPEILMH